MKIQAARIVLLTNGVTEKTHPHVQIVLMEKEWGLDKEHLKKTVSGVSIEY